MSGKKRGNRLGFRAPVVTRMSKTLVTTFFSLDRGRPGILDCA
jgi:hypothetical protein